MNDDLRKLSNRIRKEKKAIVPDDALNIDKNDPIFDTLEKVIFKSKLTVPDAWRVPANPQKLFDKFMTPLRTIISKAYTEIWVTTGHIIMTDKEYLEFTDRLNTEITKYLGEAQSLMIKHRNDIKEYYENND